MLKDPEKVTQSAEVLFYYKASKRNAVAVIDGRSSTGFQRWSFPSCFPCVLRSHVLH